MGQVSYSLCLSLIHSLWQSALLLLIYSIVYGVGVQQRISGKRNLLFLLLLVQVMISLVTFFMYYSGAFQSPIGIFETNFTGLLSEINVLTNISAWVTNAYILILSLKLIRLIYCWRQFKNASSLALVKPSIDLRLFTSVKANELGIGRNVTLWFSSRISSPLTFGFFKPVIFMPVALVNNLSISEAESLIIHELTHIRNNDYLLNWILIATENMFFFNPFIKIICNKIRLEREKNCDVQVLSFKYPVINYAETLLKAARFKTNTNVFQLSAVFKTKQLLERIHFFSKESDVQFPKQTNAAIPAFVILSALLINFFVLVNISGYKTATSDLRHRNTENNLGKVVVTSAQIPEVISNLQHGETKLKHRITAVPDPQELRPSIKKPVKKNGNPDIIFEENYAIAAADIQLDDTKDVIFKEENSATGEIVTRAYQIKWKDGEWHSSLLWMITETRPQKDSSTILKDSMPGSFQAIQ